MPAGQMIGPGSVMYVCLGVDAVQVLPPGLRTQGSEELLHGVEGGDGAVQVLQRERRLCDCCWPLSSSAVLQRSRCQVIII